VLSNLSRAVIESKYAVRGAIPMRGEEIMDDIANGNGD
jgi:hypothetical protein